MNKKHYYFITMTIFFGMLLGNELKSDVQLPKTNNPLGVQATDPALDSYDRLTMPAPHPDGKIPTLNRTGLMTQDRDPFSEAFIEEAQRCGMPVLEIGAAYGITTIEALKRGAVIVANDIEPRHLIILRQRTPKEYYKNLYLDASAFPKETNFPNDTFGAVLMCRVAHLFTPEEMELSLDKIEKILKPGGKLYITTISPYHHEFANFQEIYNERWEKGIKWPGVITNLKDYLPNISDIIPNYAHIMDDRPLVDALTKHGFLIEKSLFYDYVRPNKSLRIGKEYYGVIAVKKDITSKNEQ